MKLTDKGLLNILGLIGMVIFVGTGEHIAERFLPLYLQKITETSTAILAIGILSAMDDFLSAIYSFPGGYLSDKIGSKRALLFFNILSMIGYLCVILIQKYWAVLLGSALFISWSAISLPATMDIISKSVPKYRRTLAVSIIALARRFPKMIGPVIGGICISLWGIELGIRISFVLALILAICASIIQQIFLTENTKKTIINLNVLKLLKSMPINLKHLLISDILVRFCERIPDAFVVIWATRYISNPISELTFGGLSALENIVAVLTYIPVAFLADNFGKKPFVAITFGFFTLFPIILLYSHHLPLLVIAFIIRGLKEFGEPSRKALILDLAPDNQKASIFGLYYLLRDIPVAISAFSGALLWQIAPELNLKIAFIFGLCGTVWFIAVFFKTKNLTN